MMGSKSSVSKKNLMKAVTLLGVFAFLLFAAASTSSGEVIYYDNFDGAAGAELNATVPDVTTDDAAWVAGGNFGADGTLTFDNVGMGDSAYLPFVPQDGFIYTLTAQINAAVSQYRGSSGTNDWIALGFTQSNANPDSRFYDDNGTRTPVYWAMTRTNQSTQNDQMFVGPGTGGGADSTTSSADNIKIVLNTKQPTWTVSWFYDDMLQRTVDVGESDKVNFQYIALTNARSDGTISSLRLEDDVKLTAATNPAPADEALDVPRDLTLSWTPGIFAATHNLFLGTNFDDVNVPSHVPPTPVAVEGIDVNYFDPGRLEFGTTYYWRVDEVNAPSAPGTYKGLVWSFSVEPLAYKLPSEVITASASSSFSGYDPNQTINESGLDPANMDLHSNDQTTMWLSSGQNASEWIRYDFDKPYKLHEMMVWNYNFLLFINAGFKDVTIEYSVDGDTWAELPNVPEFAKGPGTNGYMYNTVVDLNGIVAQSVRLTANANWGGGTMPYFGLSEVRFTYIPVRPREPNPEDGASDVPANVTLSWRAGRDAAQHNVYISTDRQAVADATAPMDTVEPASYDASLDLGSTYYWRVDEVNDSESPSAWAGDIWSFSTASYVSIEDFEDYNDTPPYTIYNTWKDGLEVPAYGGSQMGHFSAPFAEKAIVQHGAQSAPIYYDNTAANVNISEVVRTFDNPVNWQTSGADALRLYYRGDAITYAEPAPGVFATSGEGADIWGTSDEFRFIYKTLSGDGWIAARVDSIQNTDPWAKAGVMIRNTLDADSAHAMAILAANGTAAFQRRLTTGGASTGGVDVTSAGHPYWVKVTRTGNTLTAERSADGINWYSFSADPNVPSSVTIAMNNTVYIGLAVTSHASGVLAAATFSEVETNGYAPDDWTMVNIGDTTQAEGTNTIDSLYVAVEDNAGNRAQVPAPANAVGSGDWMEMVIPYSQLAGVDMSKVKELTIGVGDEASPLKGKGVIYIDNISYGRMAQ